MTDKLRTLADDHPWAFWIGSLVVFMMLGYKTFSLVFLGKTDYTWDVSFLKMLLALLVILMLREIYRGQFVFHFQARHFGLGLLLGGSVWLWCIYNVYLGVCAPPIDFEATLMIVFGAMATGFYEEVLMRGFLVNHMMQHWRGDAHRILKTLAASSVLFGVLHLGNVFSAGLAPTLLQVCYAVCLGLVLAAVYLRTQNLWSVILMHGLVDSFAEMELWYAPVGEVAPETLFSADTSLMLLAILLLSVIGIVQAAFMLRKSRREEVCRIWDE